VWAAALVLAYAAAHTARAVRGARRA